MSILAGLLLSLFIIILIFCIYLFIMEKNNTKQRHVHFAEDTMYSWNDYQKEQILIMLKNMLISSLTEKDTNSIALCILDKLQRELYNYSQVKELLLRLENGGELSKDIWNLISGCIQNVLSKTMYTGKRIPRLLIDQILESNRI